MTEEQRRLFLNQQHMFQKVTDETETIELDLQECKKQKLR
jgi:hypothetical protein